MITEQKIRWFCIVALVGVMWCLCDGAIVITKKRKPHGITTTTTIPPVPQFEATVMQHAFATDENPFTDTSTAASNHAWKGTAPTWTNGYCVFSGSQYLIVTNNGFWQILNGATSFTMSVWANHAVWANHYDGLLVSYNGNYGQAIDQRNAFGKWGGFIVTTAGVSYAEASGCTTGVWYMHTMTWDGANGHTVLYSNDVAAASNTAIAATGTIYPEPYAYQYGNDVAGFPDRFFYGDLDAGRIWKNSILTAAEISTLYGLGR